LETSYSSFTPARSTKPTERRLVEEIMQVISDRKTLDIFYSISEGVGKNDLLKRTKGYQETVIL